ncbi:MAG: LemA family protein [Candidatus Omnitrophica bacterium]|nr:LemA family protein [Candidatus Omnitrophota bacterium]
MGIAAIVLIAVVAVGIGILLWWIGAYNGLVRMRQDLKSAWSQIDVQLKRRHDLIPNLVESVKGYMAHERGTLENVIKARQQAVSAGSVGEKAQAENFLTETLRSLFAVVERYPDIKANQNVMALQEELTSTENKVSFARQFYNDQAARYNAAIESVPTNIVAGTGGFTKVDFFQLDAPAERAVPQVKF